ncbi:hypothetical protein C8J57DRAFT_1475830, partial [Mycena rebaudengoi]
MDAIQAAHDELFYATFPDARPSPRSARVEQEHAQIYASGLLPALCPPGEHNGGMQPVLSYGAPTYDYADPDVYGYGAAAAYMEPTMPSPYAAIAAGAAIAPDAYAHHPLPRRLITDVSSLIEYDYSPEAYQRYLATQPHIASWVDKTQNVLQANPFAPPTPTLPHDGDRGRKRRSSTGEHKTRDVAPLPPIPLRMDSIPPRPPHRAPARRRPWRAGPKLLVQCRRVPRGIPASTPPLILSGTTRPISNPTTTAVAQPPCSLGVVDGDVHPSLMLDGGVAMSPCISSYDALGGMGGRTHDPLQLHGSHRPPSMDIQQCKRMPAAPASLLAHHLQPGSNNNAMTDQAAAAALGLRGGLGNGGGRGNVWPADDGDGEDGALARRTMAGAGSTQQQQQYEAQLQGPAENGMAVVGDTHLEPYPAPAFDPLVTELLTHGNHLHSILALTLVFCTPPSLLQVDHVLDLSWSEVRDHLLPVAELLEPPGLPEQYYSNFRISRQLQDFLLDPSRPETKMVSRQKPSVPQKPFARQKPSELRQTRHILRRGLLGPPRLQFKTLSRLMGFSPTLPYSASSKVAARTTRGYRMAEKSRCGRHTRTRCHIRASLSSDNRRVRPLKSQRISPDVPGTEAILAVVGFI